LVLALWQRSQRECQYIAVGLLERGSKRLDTPVVDLLEQWIITKSWWDTVDSLAGSLAGEQFRRFSAAGSVLALLFSWPLRHACSRCWPRMERCGRLSTAVNDTNWRRYSGSWLKETIMIWRFERLEV